MTEPEYRYIKGQGWVPSTEPEHPYVVMTLACGTTVNLIARMPQKGEAYCSWDYVELKELASRLDYRFTLKDFGCFNGVPLRNTKDYTTIVPV